MINNCIQSRIYAGQRATAKGNQSKCEGIRGYLLRGNISRFKFTTSLFAGLLLTDVLTIARDTGSTRGEGGGNHCIDLAIDTYLPPANALRVAEARAKEYWARHQERIGRDTRYLAVQSYPIFSAEIPLLYIKLLHSPSVSSVDLEQLKDNKELAMFCINIFDTRAQRLVNPQGYAVVDLPRRGSLAQFGIYTGRYIGRGE